MPKVDWLDRLTFREIEMINEKQKRDSNFMFLMIEFPRVHLDNVEYSVFYFEKVIESLQTCDVPVVLSDSKNSSMELAMIRRI